MRNADSHDQRRRRLERDRAAGWNTDERLRLEQEVLRSGDDWHSRVPAEYIENWFEFIQEHGVAMGDFEGMLLVIERDERELYPLRMAIRRRLIHDIIMGEYDHAKAIRLWSRLLQYVQDKKPAIWRSVQAHMTRPISVAEQELLAIYLNDTFLEQACEGWIDFVLEPEGGSGPQLLFEDPLTYTHDQRFRKKNPRGRCAHKRLIYLPDPQVGGGMLEQCAICGVTLAQVPPDDYLARMGSLRSSR